MPAANLEVLFQDSLRKMYYAEQRIVKALPKMQAAAQSGDLKAAFESHKEETVLQIDRIQQVFELISQQPSTQPCGVTDALLAEADLTIATYEGSPAIDAALIAAAQAVEHHEIARYGSLCDWAVFLEMPDAGDLLNQSLIEELGADDALADIADVSANEAAMRAD